MLRQLESNPRPVGPQIALWQMTSRSELVGGPSFYGQVGSADKRGISGGQKKRVNIGIELAAMPSIIFMDEPTSGLDGAATVRVPLICPSQPSLSAIPISHPYQPSYQLTLSADRVSHP